MSESPYYNQTAPETVPVTLNQTILDMGVDAEVSVYQKSGVSGHDKSITLPYEPLDGYAIKLSRNGLLQREGVDFTVNGEVITLIGDAESTDVFQIEYAYEV